MRVAVALREAVTAPILMHPDERPLWEMTHPDFLWDVDLSDGLSIPVAGSSLTVLLAPDLGCVFTGDTLFQGGPGATGRSYSDGDLIVESIRARLLPLPDETVVHTGHGADTTIGSERGGLA